MKKNERDSYLSMSNEIGVNQCVWVCFESNLYGANVH